MIHMSAMLQVTGEAEYTDDTPTPPQYFACCSGAE
uniref:XDH1 n=1 Tax=Arundo donax TaxID=35708 RepID=A0A0A9A5E0_ARUDO